MFLYAHREGAEDSRLLHTVKGAFSLLFKTTVFPAANAAAIFMENITSGKFQGIIMPATPYGSLTDKVSNPGVFVLAVP